MKMYVPSACSLECDRCDRMFEDHHQREVAAHCQVRLRLCHQKGEKQGHCRSQGQHHVRKYKIFPLPFLAHILESYSSINL